MKGIKSMRSLRTMTLAAMVTVPLSVALVVPASAADRPSIRPNTNIPACGEHFQLTRSGRNVKVIGTNLGYFLNAYTSVWAAANNKSFGPYTGSPQSGADFTINTGSTAQTTVAISLTDVDNTTTLCASDYYV
jgi:hypothetical protein